MKSLLWCTGKNTDPKRLYLRIIAQVYFNWIRSRLSERQLPLKNPLSITSHPHFFPLSRHLSNLCSLAHLVSFPVMQGVLLLFCGSIVCSLPHENMLDFCPKVLVVVTAPVISLKAADSCSSFAFYPPLLLTHVLLTCAYRVRLTTDK